MSAKDQLARFDAMWEHHMKWRRGETAVNDDKRPGQYVTSLSTYSLPIPVEGLLDSANAALTGMIDEFATRERKRLRLAARAEAEQTLATLAEEGGENG